jgi:hypothetical protein
MELVEAYETLADDVEATDVEIFLEAQAEALLEDLAARMPEDYSPQEEDWGPPVGREGW